MNYVATSDYDESYLEVDKIKKIKFFKWFYLAFILCAVSISFVPLLAGELITDNKNLILGLNVIMFVIFSLDYSFRWITYSYRANKMSKYPFIFFPFTGVSIIMIFGILPSFLILFAPLVENLWNSDVLDSFVTTLSSLVILQLGRLLLLLNVFPPFRIFTNIFQKQRKILLYVFLFLIISTLLFSIILYRAEVTSNDKINNFWDAFYFTVISICTIGYGDIVPITTLGRAMVIILAFVGIAIFTIPSAVIAAGFLEEMQKKNDENDKKIEKKEKRSLSILEKTFLKSVKKVKKVKTNSKNNQGEKGDIKKETIDITDDKAK